MHRQAKWQTLCNVLAYVCCTIYAPLRIFLQKAKGDEALPRAYLWAKTSPLFLYILYKHTYFLSLPNLYYIPEGMQGTSHNFCQSNKAVIFFRRGRSAYIIIMYEFWYVFFSSKQRAFSQLSHKSSYFCVAHCAHSVHTLQYKKRIRLL